MVLEYEYYSTGNCISDCFTSLYSAILTSKRAYVAEIATVKYCLERNWQFILNFSTNIFLGFQAITTLLKLELTWGNGIDGQAQKICACIKTSKFFFMKNFAMTNVCYSKKEKVILYTLISVSSII